MRKFAIIALSLVIGVALLEGVIRWIDWGVPRANDHDELGDTRYGFYNKGYGDLIPNQDGHWLYLHHRPYHLQTNSVGLRNKEEPDPKSFRILVLGDSYTFSPYLANNDTWPFWFENQLRNSPGVSKKIQVFNAAIAGYTQEDYLSYLKTKGAGFKPDFVVIAISDNDINDLRLHKRKQFARSQWLVERTDIDKYLLGSTRAFLGKHSAFYNFGSRIKKSLLKKGAGEQNPADERVNQPTIPVLTPQERNKHEARYRELVLETIRFLKGRQIKLGFVRIPPSSVVLHPYPNVPSSPLRIVDEVTAQEGVPLHDLKGDFVDGGTLETLYLLHKDADTGKYTGNPHLSRNGSFIAGKAVADWVLGLGVIREDVVSGKKSPPFQQEKDKP